MIIRTIILSFTPVHFFKNKYISNKKKFWIILAIVVVFLTAVILFSNKKYSQDLGENVATTRTPEETHQIFVDKIRNEDLDGAVECCFVEGSWNYTKKGLLRAKDDGSLGLLASNASLVEKKIISDTSVIYTYVIEVGEEKYGSTMGFVKDNKGVWLIESF